MSINHHKKIKIKIKHYICISGYLSKHFFFFQYNFQNKFNAGQSLQRPYKKERDKEKINSHN